MSYLSQPTLSQTELYFISEEDLWFVPIQGERRAIRLTSGQGPMASPQVSPDGKWIALASEEEGYSEIYLMPSAGGELKRLTFLGAWSYPIAWKDEKTIIFKSNAHHAHRVHEFFEISIDGGFEVAFRLGEGAHLQFSRKGEVILERNMHRPDPSYWKRYRGGTMGQFWFAKNIDAEFKKLLGLPGNLSCPQWFQDRIYYLSDESGLGRIYSCDSDGKNKKEHGRAFKSDFYFRNLVTNGNLFAFQSAGDLYFYDPKSDQIEKVEIKIVSDRGKSRRKNIQAATSFQNYSLQPQGEKLLLESRGKVFCFSHWSGPIIQIGQEYAIRYKNPEWLSCGKRVVVVSDDGLKEELEIYSDRGEKIKKIELMDLPGGLGRVIELKVSPKKDQVFISNHRNELVFVCLETGTSKVIFKNEYHFMQNFDWSPDGAFLAFSQSMSPHQTRISMVKLDHFSIHPVTPTQFEDFSPSFDSDGKYLYFISKRAFNPIYDDALFDMTFAKARLPFVVVLSKSGTSPFIRESHLPDSMQIQPAIKNTNSELKCEIDFDGIENRVIQFPVAEAKYTKVIGLGKKVLWSYEPVEGTLDVPLPVDGPRGKEYLDCFDFETGKFEFFGTGITDFKVRASAALRIVRQGNKLRIIKALEKADEDQLKEGASPKSGVIDLSRIQFLADLDEEWRHMYRDAWRQQKEYFWREDLCGVDWDSVYRRYEPILKKINCRREFSDLIWELIGELGTSHAYERGGDYRPSPLFPMGYFGASFKWNSGIAGYEILDLLEGDRWNESCTSPLLSSGVALKVGDVLFEVNGKKLTADFSPQEAALHLSGGEVLIRVKRKEHSEMEMLLIKLLKQEQSLRYRDWVEKKRAFVKEKSGGKLGYLHIPNMVGQGFAEFHRGFIQELGSEGLIVDVRYNGGGHVSQLILDRLARQVLGKDVSRWLGTKNIPFEASPPTVIALTNEYAGSDGDIFSHTFKMRKIGKLIGTRTWGGVVGIWPRTQLIDGGYTTQPEFSTWFEDVGYRLENHGAEPDLVIDFPPHEVRQGKDPQLEFAIDEALKSVSRAR